MVRNWIVILGISLFFVSSIYPISITYSGSNVLFLRVVDSEGNIMLNGKDVRLEDLIDKLEESASDYAMLVIAYNPNIPTSDTTKLALEALVKVIKTKAENAGIKNFMIIEEGKQKSILTFSGESEFFATPQKTEPNQDWITFGERRITRDYYNWIQSMLSNIVKAINNAKDEEKPILREKYDTLVRELISTDDIRKQFELFETITQETVSFPATPLGDRFGRMFEIPADKKEKLITNGGFEDAMSGWTVGHSLDLSKSNWNCKVVYDQNKKSNVIQFERGNSNASGSSVGIFQDVFIDLTKYKDVKLRLDVCPIYQSFSGGGWVGGEYPIMVQIAFIDEQSNPYVWTYGFIYDGESEYENVTKIYQLDWFTYTSPNLKEILPDSADGKRLYDLKRWGQPYFEYKPPVKPKYINRVLVFGSGWDFKSRADNIEFILTPQ